MYTIPLTSSHPPSLPSSVLLHTAGHVVAVLSTTDFTLRLLASRTLVPLQPYLALTPPRLPVLSEDTVHNSHYSLLTSSKGLHYTHSTLLYKLASCSKLAVSPAQQQTQRAAILEQLHTS